MNFQVLSPGILFQVIEIREFYPNLNIIQHHLYWKWSISH